MKFLMGQVVMTPSVEAVMMEHKVSWIDLLKRHSNCDWGVLDPEDVKANEDALKYGNRILSSYPIPNTDEKIWIISEADRSVTTLLLPSDY